MQDDFNVFIPFSKKDEDKRLVYGYASTEAVDSQGEIVEKSAIEGALPDYMKFGNIREMHQAIAVGKAQSAKMDNKGLFLVAKIVDKGAWEKVKEGVYNGFSIGGRKLMTMGNKIKKLLLSEISIVDRPANPEALFTLVKFNKDGGEVESDSPSVKPESKEEKKTRESMTNMFDAAYVLSMAKELAYLYMSYKQMGRNTKSIEAAITNLKACAKENLGKAEMSEMDKILKTEYHNNALVWQDKWEEEYFNQMQKVLG